MRELLKFYEKGLFLHDWVLKENFGKCLCPLKVGHELCILIKSRENLAEKCTKMFKDNIFKNSPKTNIDKIFLLTYLDLEDQKPVNEVKFTLLSILVIIRSETR